MSDSPTRVVTLISGRGTNMAALVDALAAEPSIEFVAVISNVPEVPGLALADARGITTRTLSHRGFPERAAFDSTLRTLIDSFEPDLVVLAGFMRILTDAFVEHYRGRMLNIHPSLLPDYPGLNTHARALADGVPEHGATVHFVTPALDGGPGILQGRVNVLVDDDDERLAARVLEVEHQIYPEVLRWYAAGRLKLTGDQVALDGATLTSPLQHRSNRACSASA